MAISRVAITFVGKIIVFNIILFFAALAPRFVTTEKSMAFVNVSFLSGKKREIYFFLIMILALYVSCTIDFYGRLIGTSGCLQSQLRPGILG